MLNPRNQNYFFCIKTNPAPQPKNKNRLKKHPNSQNQSPRSVLYLENSKLKPTQSTKFHLFKSKAKSTSSSKPQISQTQATEQFLWLRINRFLNDKACFQNRLSSEEKKKKI